MSSDTLYPSTSLFTGCSVPSPGMLEKERERQTDRHKEIENETERNEINRLMGWREEEEGPIGKEKVRRGAWEAGFGCWPVRRASPSLTWGCC